MKEIFRITLDEAREEISEWVEIFRQNGIHLEILGVDVVPIHVYADRDEIIATHGCGNDEMDDRFVDCEFEYDEEYGGLVSLEVMYGPDYYYEGGEYNEILIANLRDGYVVELDWHDSRGWLVTDSEKLSSLELCEVLPAIRQWATYMGSYKDIVVEWKLSWDAKQLYISNSASELRKTMDDFGDFLDEETLEELKGILEQKVQDEIDQLKRLVID